MNIHSDFTQELPMSSKSRIASSILLALALGLAACQSDDDGGANGVLGTRLTTPTTLAIAAGSQAEVSGRDQQGADVSVGPLMVERGTMTVRRTDGGDLQLDRFDVELGDVIADDGTLAGHPRTLTNVKLSLGRAIVLGNAWSLTGETAYASASGDLRLDWSLVGDDGQVLPLSTQKIANADVFVYVAAEADGSISGRLSVKVDGKVFGNWGVELRDFSMDVDAAGGN
jgi:hypothetical protein